MMVSCVTRLWLVLMMCGCGWLQLYCPQNWRCDFDGGRQGKAESSAGDTENITVVVELKDGEQIVTINCENRDKPLTYKPGMFVELGFDSAPSFRLMKCHQPNISFGEILEPWSTQVSKLRFSNQQKGESFDPTLFEGFPNLTHLNLDFNYFTSLPNDSFANFSQLMSVTVRVSLLQELPEDIFASNPNLVGVDFSDNRLESIGSQFRNLSKLGRLILIQNRIKLIRPDAFVGLPMLKSIDLQGNNLEHLPTGVFDHLLNLDTLRIFNNRLVHLPENLFIRNTNLSVLDISGNPLTELPPGLFRSLKRLLLLNICCCNLKSLEKDTFQSLPNLQKLELDKNQLSSLPPDIFHNSRKLVELNLASNNISSLSPKLFYNLHVLAYLDMSRNQLTTLPETVFDSLNNLTNIQLKYNQLTSIPINTFFGSRKVNFTELDISHNLLSYPSADQPDEFRLPLSTTKVNLANNRYVAFPIRWLITNNALETIDLSHNRMVVFSSSDFQVTSDSLKMNLEYNNISHIYVNESDLTLQFLDTEERPSTLPAVQFGNNPITCDCSAETLLKYLRHDSHKYKFEFDVTNVKCATPSTMAGRSISSITLRELNCEIVKDCPPGCRCLLQAWKKITEVVCSNLGNMTSMPWPVPLNTSILRMDGTGVRHLDNISPIQWSSLRELYLNSSKLETFSVVNFPPGLRYLNLAGSRLQSLAPEVLNALAHKSRFRIALHNNPWSCECSESALALKQWLNQNAMKVENMTSIQCNGTMLAEDTNLRISLFEAIICPDHRVVIITIVCIVLAMAAITATLAVGYYRYRRPIQVWMYANHLCLWFFTEDDFDSDKTYDAFVSFSQEDSDFVAHHLLPGLEGGEPRYRLCIHYRDWLAGEWIPDQIVRSVEESKRTIVVLSKHFIQSVWGRLEFRTAYHQVLQDKTNRIIVVVIGDVPSEDEMDPELRTYVKFNTYLKWGDPWFWKKLRFAMPHKTCNATIFSESHVLSLPDPTSTPTTPISPTPSSSSSTALCSWTPLPKNKLSEHKIELITSHLSSLR